MILIFKKGVKDIKLFLDYFTKLGLEINTTNLDDQIILKLKGETFKIDDSYLASFKDIERIVRIDKSFDLVRLKDKYTNIKINNVSVGNDSKFLVIAGPCSITSYETLKSTCDNMSRVDIIRGGAFKPRKSPYAFQGIGEEGLDILKRVGDENHTPVISEIMDTDDLESFIDKVDVIQVGARNMSNFSLLKKLGKVNKPILLKRGQCSTVEEWLLAAEYIVKNGNKNVILCERGIKTFETATRNTLDLSAVSLVKQICSLPVIVDPSHATGRYDLVSQMALAAVACGADGIMLEVSQNIEGLKSDGSQTLSTKRYNELLIKMQKVAEAIGRDF